MRKLAEIGGRRFPFLRWSVLRMMLGARNLLTNWQVGDGREEALARHVTAHARAGDLDDVIRAIDDFCYRQRFMMNVGDEKGEILDRAVDAREAPAAARARHLLRLQRAADRARHAGRGATSLDRVQRRERRDRAPHLGPRRRRATASTVVVGSLGDGGQTIARPRSGARLRDAARSTSSSSTTTRPPTFRTSSASSSAGWLRRGAIVVADNVKVPGAPKYRAYMQAHEGGLAHGRARHAR